jgi:hypothetical protein
VRGSDLEFYTVLLPDRAAQLDGRIARCLASKFKLRHRALPMEEALQEDLEQWMWRIGCSAGEVRGWESIATLRTRDPMRTYILGNVGVVAGHYYWRRGGLMQAVIEHACPELLALPFNRDVGIRRLYQRAARRGRMLRGREPKRRQGGGLSEQVAGAF